MDFDDMIFPAGSTFIFGSWFYVADDDGRLQSQLMEILPPQHTLAAPANMMDQLVENFSQLLISDSIQISEVPNEFDSSSVTPEEINQESNLGSTPEVPNPYPLGPCNATFVYQDLLQGQVNLTQEIPLTGAQRGLVLSITPQGFIVHWPRSRLDDSYPDSS
jgi:hypothetical protein